MSTSRDPTASFPSDISKLNVSQLKALCKERRIVGYSKLAKAALLRKLGELHSLATSTSPQSAQPQTQADNLLSKAGSSSSQVDDSPSLAVRRPGSMGPPSLPSHGPVSDTPVPCTHIPP